MMKTNSSIQEVIDKIERYQKEVEILELKIELLNKDLKEIKNDLTTTPPSPLPCYLPQTPSCPYPPQPSDDFEFPNYIGDLPSTQKYYFYCSHNITDEKQ